MLDELKKKTPVSVGGHRTVRYHQYLTSDLGEPNLTAQINQVITIFQLSDNMAEMWAQFNKLKRRQQGQLFLPYDFDDKGYTIEPKKEKKPVQPPKYEIDPFLSQALNYNPKDKEPSE